MNWSHLNLVLCFCSFICFSFGYWFSLLASFVFFLCINKDENLLPMRENGCNDIQCLICFGNKTTLLAMLIVLDIFIWKKKKVSGLNIVEIFHFFHIPSLPVPFKFQSYSPLSPTCICSSFMQLAVWTHGPHFESSWLLLSYFCLMLPLTVFSYCRMFASGLVPFDPHFNCVLITRL